MGTLTGPKASSKRTLCEIHREIYDELEGNEDTDQAIWLLHEAFELGNKIVGVLTGCGVEIIYKPNKNWEASKKRRLGRK
jgi:hypothetical protein